MKWTMSMALNMNGEKRFEYGEQDFTYAGKSWEHWTDADLSKFDNRLQETWTHCMNKGIFRYKIESNTIRIVPGRHKFILQSNPLRGKERRQPELIQSLSKPFDPDKFNFTKVKEEEVIMHMCPKYLHGSSSSRDNEDDKAASSHNHQLIVNVSPIINYHVLLVPEIQQCNPQSLTLTAIQLSLEMILLSSHPGFRVLFNSLCALASVNHQHLHALYLDYPLYVDHCAVKPVQGPLYEIEDGPTTGFVLQLGHCKVEELANQIYMVTHYLQEAEIAHNMVITRGVHFGKSENNNCNTIRAIIWPRIAFHGEKKTGDTSIFNVAAAELGGHVPIYRPEMYETLTEDYIVDGLQELMLPLKDYDHIKDDLKLLFAGTRDGKCTSEKKHSQ